MYDINEEKQKNDSTKPVRILGISCFYHDSAAALLVDGVIVAAAQEERFTRKKHDPNFPKNATAYCLESRGLTIDDIDYVVFYDKPITKFERLLQTYIKVWPRGLKSFVMSMGVWLKEKLWIEQLIAKELGYNGDIYFSEHHYSHAASAYYCSDFDESAVVTMDGVGEWDTTTVGYGVGNELKIAQTIHFPHSLGLLYSALTYYLGFKVNSAEYKVMGLAPYGDPEVYIDRFRTLIDIKDDGSFQLDMSYFSYEHGLRMTSEKFNDLFGGPPRTPESELDQKHKDIAAALQLIVEEVILKIVNHAYSLHPSQNLCLAGGVALNCVANGRILREGPFENVYIKPAAGDAGGAVGAACYMYFDVLKNEKRSGVFKHPYVGPEFTQSQIDAYIQSVEEKIGQNLSIIRCSEEELPSRVAQFIADNYIVGWFQGAMEFGPRALGNRSILADARNKDNWQRVNLMIKYRESFRPFAPSVLEEYADDFFDLRGVASPYMLLVADVKRQDVPAVTHVDNSARIQTVSKSDNPLYHKLLEEFRTRTGCPVFINTSFNVRGEPIVCTPQDAFSCFVNTEMDCLVLGDSIIFKTDNPILQEIRDTESYLTHFTLD